MTSDALIAYGLGILLFVIWLMPTTEDTDKPEDK
jgi:hypothetical protein